MTEHHQQWAYQANGEQQHRAKRKDAAGHVIEVEIVPAEVKAL